MNAFALWQWNFTVEYILLHIPRQFSEWKAEVFHSDGKYGFKLYLYPHMIAKKKRKKAVVETQQ